MASETDPALSDSSDHIGDIAIEPTNGAASGGGKKNGKRNGKDKKKEKEVPIEELYDLSQPIKRVRAAAASAAESYLQFFMLSNNCIFHFADRAPLQGCTRGSHRGHRR